MPKFRFSGGCEVTSSPATANRAPVGSLEAGDHPQQRGLAAAARSQQHEYLTLGHLE